MFFLVLCPLSIFTQACVQCAGELSASAWCSRHVECTAMFFLHRCVVRSMYSASSDPHVVGTSAVVGWHLSMACFGIRVGHLYAVAAGRESEVDLFLPQAVCETSYVSEIDIEFTSKNSTAFCIPVAFATIAVGLMLVRENGCGISTTKVVILLLWLNRRLPRRRLCWLSVQDLWLMLDLGGGVVGTWFLVTTIAGGESILKFVRESTKLAKGVQATRPLSSLPGSLPKTRHRLCSGRRHSCTV